MEDEEILALIWERDESGLEKLERRYTGFCHTIAHNLLSNGEDAEECVNETFFQVWNKIPPERPEKLKPWLGKLVRNNAIKLYRKSHAQKRDAAMTQTLHELEEVLPFSGNLEKELEASEVGEWISKWLLTLTKSDRILFVRRYWYGVPIKKLAKETGVSANALAQKMYRLRAPDHGSPQTGGEEYKRVKEKRRDHRLI